MLDFFFFKFYALCNTFFALNYCSIIFVSRMVTLIEVLMITNQGYWLLMVSIELSDRLKLIKHQMKIFQG